MAGQAAVDRHLGAGASEVQCSAVQCSAVQCSAGIAQVLATMQRYLGFPVSQLMLQVIMDPHGSLSNCRPQFEREVRSLQLFSSHPLAPGGYFTVRDVIDYLGTNGLALL